MKRTQMTKNIYSSFNTNPVEFINRNIGNPNVIDPPPSSNERTPAVQIIEINSDGTDSDRQHRHHRYNNKLENININARERIRLKYEDYIFDNETKYESDYLNQTFNSHCGSDSDRDERIFQNQIKCLRIINNNLEFDKSLDTERSDDIEVFQFKETAANNILWNCNNSYKIFECGDISQEEQYKWMYSSKNIKLSAADNEISSFTSTETDSTIADDDDTSKSRTRVPTPIFNYIPKLNLPSSPLPTLPEVAEPNKLSDTDTSSNYSKLLRKSVNSWLQDGSDENKSIENIQSKLSTLSQRERRRNKIANIIGKKLENIEQHNLYCEPEVTIKMHPMSRTSVGDTEQDLSPTDNTKDTMTTSEDLITNKDDTEAKNYSLNSLTKETSDPVEKLQGNWIDNDDDSKEVYDYDLNTVDSTRNNHLSNEDSRADYSANVFLKVAGKSNGTFKMPYLHLSFETDCDEDKRSCFKRLFKYILCCK